MKSIVLLALIVSTPAFANAKIDPQLKSFAQSASQTEQKVLVIMDSPSGIGEIPQRYHRHDVLSYLNERTQVAFKKILRSMKDHGLASGDIRKVHLYYINNSFSALVNKQGLKLLAKTPGVKKIYDGTRKVKLDPPVKRGIQSMKMDANGLPYDFAEIGLDKLMNEAPEITGKGVVIGSVDTGVDGKHPALAGKILKFYNGQTKKTSDPVDFDEHGTHTIGTMVGGNRSDNIFGLAPDAKMISAGVLIDYDTMVAGMQFMLDPDGDPNTNDMPRAVNNSWNSNGAPDQEIFYKAIAAWEAAAILPVFSAGNAGPGKGSITHPHENPATFATGATGPDGKIAYFSSRGPGNYKGQSTKKPDVTAPGVNIRSCVPGGKYEGMSGTSMAAPHVTGSAALLFQIDHELTPEQVRAIFIKTARPTKEQEDGDSWNPVYGYGKLDVYAAAKVTHKLALRRELASNGYTGPLDFLNSLLTTAEDVDTDMLLGLEDKPADLEFPVELEGKSWLTPQEAGL